ncbi:MAG: BLI-3 blue-light-inducible Bli-3 protein [Candelina submexicana]|nr:MAG: BLI-3 blue-light-inducible Bli-3 protein [Candelina submexicana]
MSSFSNASTGDKPADPYKAKNADQAPLSESIEDLTNFIDKCKFGMMTTRIESSGLLVSRCMAIAAKEGGGVDLIFHTNTESGKTDDLKSDPKINVSFVDSTGSWASISGEASIITEREVIRKYYSPALKAWIGDLGDGKHDGGPEDPRIGVIKVKALTITYAVSSTGLLGRTAELVKGIATGESPSVNKLRELSTEDIEKWRSIHKNN